MKKIKLTTLEKTSLTGINTEHVSLMSDVMKLSKAAVVKGVLNNVLPGELRDLPVGQDCILYIKAHSNFSAVFLLTYRSASIIFTDTISSNWSVSETYENATSQSNIVKPKGSDVVAKLKNGSSIPLNYQYVIIPVGAY